MSLRYVHLGLNVSDHLGSPSNHALHVTQQHTLVTFSVAATLARIADAEWARTCECIRRISPTIGSLGEWRSLCEGAWTGPLPDNLPEVSSETQVPITPGVSEWGGLSTPVRRLLPVPPLTSHSPGSASVSAASSLDPPRSPFTAANQDQNQGSINSITTLSAFPFPPTHFPVPLVTNEAELQRQQTQLQNLPFVHSRAASPNAIQSHGALAPPAPILTDSPKQVTDFPDSLALDASRSSSSQMSQTPSTSHQPNQDAREPPTTEPSTVSAESKNVIKPIASGMDPKKPRRLSLIARVPPPSDKSIRPVSPFKRAEHSSGENEFGIHTDVSTSSFKSHSIDAAKKNLERTGSTLSTANHVAALRNRYTRTVGCFLRFNPVSTDVFLLQD